MPCQGDFVGPVVTTHDPALLGREAWRRDCEGIESGQSLVVAVYECGKHPWE